MTGWLYQRLLEEDPNISPGYSLRGTANWLRALSLLCSSQGFSNSELVAFYESKVRRKTVNRQADTLVFEQMMMGFHQLSALYQITEQQSNPYDSVRLSIVAWYYGLYYAGGAMVAAKDGTHHENHSGTARAWKSHIADIGHAVLPFSLKVSSLVKETYRQEISELRSDLQHNPHVPAQNREQALEVCLSHLKGASEWYREKEETSILECKEFKKLGATNFRKKEARLFRDGRLQRKSVGFLHQAYRYRGKAHYRDAIYLSYGEDQTQLISKLNNDLYLTLSSFIRMASHYCSRRVEKGAWAQFVTDVEENSLLSHEVDVMRTSK